MTIAGALTRQLRIAAPVLSLISKDYIGEGRWDGELPKEAKLIRLVAVEGLEALSEDGYSGPVRQRVAAVCFARTMAEADNLAQAVLAHFDYQPFTRDGYRYMPVAQDPDPDYNLDGQGDGNSMAVPFLVTRRAL